MADLDKIRELFPKGAKVYTLLRHVSQSGMSRVISVLVVDDGDIYDWTLLLANNMPQLGKYSERYRGITVTGGGMDMGAWLVYVMGSRLYGDGYALKHRWI